MGTKMNVSLLEGFHYLSLSWDVLCRPPRRSISRVPGGGHLLQCCEAFFFVPSSIGLDLSSQLYTVLSTVAAEKKQTLYGVSHFALLYKTLSMTAVSLPSSFFSLRRLRKVIFLAALYYSQQYFVTETKTFRSCQSFFFLTHSVDSLLLRRDWSTADGLLDVFEMEICGTVSFVRIYLWPCVEHTQTRIYTHTHTHKHRPVMSKTGHWSKSKAASNSVRIIP